MSIKEALSLVATLDPNLADSAQKELDELEEELKSYEQDFEDSEKRVAELEEVLDNISYELTKR